MQSGYKGKLLFNDLEIAGTDTESIAEEIIYLRQSPSLNLLAATSMLDLGIWQAGFEVNNIDEAAIEKALNYFDMLNYKDKPVWELSEGQRQRVALAALLLNKQKIWLLDEPAAGLDSTRQRQLKTDN